MNYLVFILLFFAYTYAYGIFTDKSKSYRTMDNELDKTRKINKLKEDVKHRRKGVGLEKN